MSKQYTLPEDEQPAMVLCTKGKASKAGAGEPVVAYAMSQEHTAMYYQMSKVHDEKDVEAVAKKVCINDESYKYHEQYGFYQAELPEQEYFASEEEFVASLDDADEEGYITDEETNHIMNLWKVVD